jgi:GAF domain-containing protein/anti-sigma regulatory factor (Ser/Thr protein kinase)
MASEVSTVGAEQDLHREVEQLTRELAQSRKAEQALSRELAQASEQQAATADVLKAISRSASDLQSVLDALVSSAAHLCEAPMVAIHVRSETGLPGRARVGFPPEMVSAIGKIGQVMGRGSLVGRVLGEGHAVHIPDVDADAEYTFHDFTRVTGARTLLGLPLVRDGRPVGILSVYRTAVSPFSPKQIALMTTFADQAMIAIENARLFEEVQARTRELTESLEYQTATSDVLQVISRSPGRLQPVYDAMLASALRNCDAKFGGLFRYDGRVFCPVAAVGIPEDIVASAQPALAPELAQLAETRQPIHSPDLRQSPSYLAGDPFIVRTVERGGARAALLVPLVKDDSLIGAFAIYRQEAHPFTDKQIQLVQTFADQAVIAIENARLLEAEQAGKRDLKEALEYQTAISNVLGVISRSQFDLQPVLQSVVDTAVRLCRADHAIIFRLKEGTYRFAAGCGPFRQEYLEIERNLRISPGQGTLVGRVALTRGTVQIDDALADPAYANKDDARIGDVRSMLGVPLIRDGEVVGIIGLVRTRVEPFTEREVELITTFADQAVIAIENTRLFEEVKARTRELTEALEQQTATSEVLSVISASPGELRLVFQAILEKATQICEAKFATLFRFDGERFHPASGIGRPAELVEAHEKRGAFNAVPGTTLYEVYRTKKVVHTEDDAAVPEPGAHVKFGGARSTVGIPMIKDGALVGVIVIYRQEVRPFSDKQVELVANFAKQAVIAIENTRLFEEVQARTRSLSEALEYQTATGDVLNVISRSPNELQPVFDAIALSAAKLCNANLCNVFRFDGQLLHAVASHLPSVPEAEAVNSRQPSIRPGRGSAAARAIASRSVAEIPDARADSEYEMRHIASIAHLRSILAVPMLKEGRPIGAIAVGRPEPGRFPERQVELLKTFADQAVIAIENARLFNEITQKSRELEIASQHKSQFVANMSHELRTPLAAILGYAELIQEGLYGPLPEKSLDALTRIRSNGKHLLGLINTVLDIAKIESGQFSLNLGEYALESVVETVRGATESLAATKKLAFRTEVAKSLPIGLGDEQRLTQVLLNLVGNAIKFTDSGEVRVVASTQDGNFSVAVIDTGPGIPPDQHARVFDQFHQVDSSNTKAKGGTGLGLAIAKQIVEMHGGRIWVESTLGNGATFHMQLPVRVATAKIAP